LDYTQVYTRSSLPRRESDDWPRIQQAWTPRPNPRLNCLLFGERLQLISFQPCSFECEAAREFADAKAELVAREFPAASIALERLLARAVAVDPQNRRAWVELAVDDHGDERIVAVAPIQTDDRTSVGPLLDRLLGRRVDALGWVEHATPIRVFRFDLGSEPEPLEPGPTVRGADST